MTDLPPAVSRQAVASLVLAALLCVPMGGLAAMVLGWRSLRAIRRSNGRLTGAVLARAGLCLGAAGFVAQFLSLQLVVAAMRTHIEQDMVACIRATFDDPAAAASGRWMAGGAPADRIESFVAEAENRYGAFRYAVITATLKWESGMTGGASVVVTLAFENDSRVGGAEFAIVPAVGGFYPAARLRRLVIGDTALGDLSLGAGEQRAGHRPFN